MQSILSAAELRMLKSGGVKFSLNYRRLLCVRIKRKLALAIELLSDPRAVSFLEELNMDEVAQRFYAHESFRRSFMFGLQGVADNSPVIE